MRLALVVVASLLAAAAQAQTPPLVGGDRDAHGCIGSAGYTWCAREAQCVRPWELAASRGFANTPRAFRRWCFPARR
ncbi:MAG: hypothetical protein IPL88_06160 [Rhizobiales bacterium]|nr:hypothetical protein [Hyphomicrobiales bacterium]